MADVAFIILLSLSRSASDSALSISRCPRREQRKKQERTVLGTRQGWAEGKAAEALVRPPHWRNREGMSETQSHSHFSLSLLMRAVMRGYLLSSLLGNSLRKLRRGVFEAILGLLTMYCFGGGTNRNGGHAFGFYQRRDSSRKSVRSFE